ncbi:hypothetical protein [Pedobacter caeni]|nr:hypothetical protein [Pedobacter caeni]
MRPLLTIVTELTAAGEMMQGATEVKTAIMKGNPLVLPSIRNHKDQEIFQVILMSLAKSYTDLGREQPPQKDKDYLANELADSIPRKFPSIRLHEIPLAFSNGIREKYGTFYGLSVVSFEKFIEAHLNSEAREQLAKEVLIPNKNKVPDLMTQFGVAKKNALNAFNELQSGKEMISGAVVYGFLDGLGLISFSAAEKWEFVEEACLYLTRMLNQQLISTGSRIKREEIQRKLNALQDRSAVDMIRSMSKRFALSAFFKSVVMEELDLEVLIEERRTMFITLNKTKHEN